MGCILHDLHLQAGDDEEESGPNVSHVTRPEERRLPPHVTHSHTCTDTRKLPPARRHESKHDETQKRLNTEPQGVPEALDR